MSIRHPVSIPCACGCGQMTKGQSKSGFVTGHANRGRSAWHLKGVPGFPDGVLIDALDRERFGGHRWSIGGNGYVQRHVVLAAGKYSKSRLHREVMDAAPGDIVDHINGNRLDCRRENLRIVDDRGNAQNQSKSPKNTSGYRGVSWHKQNQKWYAYAKINGVMISLGFFDDVHEAGAVAKKFRKRHYEAFVDR